MDRRVRREGVRAARLNANNVHVIGLVVALIICYSAAALGSLFTVPRLRTWYVSLRKPSWNPPNGVFGPVWSALYSAMAISLWLVWTDAGFAAWFGLTLFALQLLLNIAWSWLFFTRRNPAAAFVDIVALWLAIGATALAFAQINRLAALLLLPYLAWVSFAAALNLAIVRRNPLTR